MRMHWPGSFLHAYVSHILTLMWCFRTKACVSLCWTGSFQWSHAATRWHQIFFTRQLICFSHLVFLKCSLWLLVQWSTLWSTWWPTWWSTWWPTWWRGCCKVWSGCSWAHRRWPQLFWAWGCWWDSEEGRTDYSCAGTGWPAAPTCNHT